MLCFLFQRIDHFDKEIKIQIDYMRKNFSDTITFKVRIAGSNFAGVSVRDSMSYFYPLKMFFGTS